MASIMKDAHSSMITTTIVEDVVRQKEKLEI